MIAVSVIIPNYNGEKYLKSCLESLKNQTMTDYELIIVDNASKDNWEKIVLSEYPTAKVIKLSQNHGFARAVNEGIRASSGEYVLLLNNDTCVDPEFIEKLYASIKEDNRIFSVGAKMVQMYNRELVDSAGDLYCALGWAFAIGKDKSIDKYNTSRDVFSACAGAAIYRKSLFDVIGYFDEKHSSYLEDVDIGYRARINGYRNVYEPKALVYHAGSGVSGSRYNSFKIGLSARNSVYLIYKNMPFVQIILNLPFLLVGYIIKALFFVKKGEGRTYLKGVIEGFKMCSNGEKYCYSNKNFKNYVRIQLELWCNIIRRFFGE